MRRVAALTLLSTIALGCTHSASPTVAPDVTSQQQASTSRSMGLSFPSETSFLIYHRASDDIRGLPAPDDAVHLKIEIPASALADFLNQTPLSSANWTTTTRWVTDVPQWSAWQPSQVDKFRSQQFQLPNGQALNVLIDDDRDDTKIIYLFWFET